MIWELNNDDDDDCCAERWDTTRVNLRAAVKMDTFCGFCLLSHTHSLTCWFSSPILYTSRVESSQASKWMRKVKVLTTLNRCQPFILLHCGSTTTTIIQQSYNPLVILQVNEWVGQLLHHRRRRLGNIIMLCRRMHLTERRIQPPRIVTEGPIVRPCSDRKREREQHQSDVAAAHMQLLSRSKWVDLICYN